MTEFQIDILTKTKLWRQKLPDYKKIVKQIVEKTFDKVDFPNIADYIELSVILADDKYIKDINHKFRNIDKATNILSFPNMEIDPNNFGDIKTNDRYLMLGDMILSLSIIENESISNKISLRDHVYHLIIHGTLHLLGFDHENDDDAKIMENYEIDILSNFEIKSPY